MPSGKAIEAAAPQWATQALIDRLAEIVTSGRIADASSNSIACIALSAVIAAAAPFMDEGWRPIESAPKDGTPILAWSVHPNARWAGDDKEWAAVVVTQWINHNGGGWTWYGLAGTFTHWHPLPAPPLPPEGEQ